MPFGKIVVHVFQNEGKGTVEFPFVLEAKLFARHQVEAGKAIKAVVVNREGTVIYSYPAAPIALTSLRHV